MFNNLPYFLYMAESEGMTGIVNTRAARINAVINDFIKAANMGDSINDMRVQNAIFAKNNIDIETLTEKEKHEIAARVENLL